MYYCYIYKGLFFVFYLIVRKSGNVRYWSLDNGDYVLFDSNLL